jgi:hypothetical protein
MRPLIEVTQESLIVCDNPECGYKVSGGDFYADIKEYVNKPCPECGENLLTEQDYKDSVVIQKMVRWLNKWFSWTTVFTRDKGKSKVSVHVHDGINIEKLN